MKILVVDDDPDVRSLLSHMLERDGHLPIALSRGDEVLPMLKVQPDVGLIFLDWMMPGKNGMEVLAELAGGGVRRLSLWSQPGVRRTVLLRRFRMALWIM